MEEQQQQGLETLSEAVYLDAVSDDGGAGFVVRLCRYPEAGFAWVWGHLFVNGEVFAFTDHELPCDAAATDLDDDPVRYALTWKDGSLSMTRSGSRKVPRSCRLTAAFSAHHSPHPPHGSGEQRCRLEAEFHASAAAVSNRAGRSEVLGTVQATVQLAGRNVVMAGRGQFHEQVQRDPRFTAPFSYLTLRGPDIGLIAIRGARGARGHLLTPDAVHTLGDIELTPPGSRRRVVLHGDNAAFHGELETTYDYSVPVFGGCRPGTLVRGSLDGKPVSGCVNDYLLDQLAIDRWR